jgi:hypothetical protein
VSVGAGGAGEAADGDGEAADGDGEAADTVGVADGEDGEDGEDGAEGAEGEVGAIGAAVEVADGSTPAPLGDGCAVAVAVPADQAVPGASGR